MIPDLVARGRRVIVPDYAGFGRSETPTDRNPVFPFPQSGQFFCELIATAAEQVQVRAAGHFLQEDRGELLASEVLKFPM